MQGSNAEWSSAVRMLLGTYQRRKSSLQSRGPIRCCSMLILCAGTWPKRLACDTTFVTISSIVNIRHPRRSKLEVDPCRNLTSYASTSYLRGLENLLNQGSSGRSRNIVKFQSFTGLDCLTKTILRHRSITYIIHEYPHFCWCLPALLFGRHRLWP
jgi:hypothetical protein